MLRKSTSRESGNIFFVLFGAVAVVGLLGTTIVSTMRGPLSTMVEVQARTQAESEMAIASRLALLEATELTNDGDCDSDGFVEPVEYLDAGGAGPTGGGFLPNAISSAKIDPWGTEYGYCSWDAGGTAGAIACDTDSNATNERLNGNGSTTDETYTVIAVISAGADQVFNTSCTGGASPSVSKGGDDIVVEYTYATANAASGGLWNIQSGNPNVAEISKDLDVTGGATFTGGLDLTASTAQVQLGAASLLFPDESTLTTCNGANDGLIRIDTSTDPDTLQICDDPTGWVAIGSNLWSTGTGDNIYYNTGTPQVGIGNTSPSEALDVTGNIAASGNISASGALNGATLSTTGNTTIGGTLGVTGTSNLAAVNATGAADFDSTLNADGATTLGSTLDVTGAATLSSTLDAQGNISDSTGDLTLDDNIVVTGTSDLQGNIANSTGDLTIADNLVVTGTIDAQGSISNSTGNVDINDSVDISNDLDVTGDIDGENISAGTQINVNGDQLGPATNCSSAQKLQWTNGSGWSCVTDLQGGSGGGIPALNDLSDVVITSVAGDQCLIYNSGSGNWVNAPCEEDLSDNNISELQNVSASGATSGQVLIFNGTNWVNASVSGDATLASGGALTIAANAVEESMINAVGAPTDEYCLTYEASTTNFEWQICSAISSIPDDSLDWDKFVDTMTLDATTTIDMDTNTADLNFDANTFVIDSSANAVGIGTAAPTSTLTTQTALDTENIFTIEADNATPGAKIAGIDIRRFNYDPTGLAASIDFYRGNSATEAEIAFSTTNNGPSGGVPTERMRIRNDGRIGVGTLPDDTAILDIASTTLGLLPPRMTTVQRNAISSPATGLLVYNSTTNSYQFYNGSAWSDIGAGAVVADSLDWDDFTDTMTLDATTTIDMDTNTANLNFDANTLFIDSVNNRIGIGTNTPSESLVVGSTSSVVARFIGGADSQIRLENTDHLMGMHYDATTDDLQFRLDGTLSTDTKLSIQNNGAIAIGKNGVNADVSAILDIVSTTGGALFPRMTTTQRNAINSGTFATSLLVYNTTDNAYQYYDGSTWRTLLSGTGTTQVIDDLGDAFHDTTTDFDGDTVDNDDNLALGHEFPALDGTNPGARNTAIGARTLDAVTTGDGNVAIGYDAATNITTGYQNTISGLEAGRDLITGYRNTFIGYEAGLNAQGAHDNIAIGYKAGERLANANDYSNVFIGNAAGRYNGGQQNVFIGAVAGNGASGSTRNTIAIGFASFSGGTGDENIIIGRNSGQNIEDDYNTILGQSSGVNMTSGEQNILVGANTDTSAASASHELNIGSVIFGNIDDSGTTPDETQFGIGVTNASTINASALVEFASTTRGALFPRMTTAQRDAINSGTFATSLLVFNTTDNAYQYYDGTSWRTILSGASGDQFIDDLGDAFHDTTTDFDGDTNDDDDNLALGHEFPGLDGTNPGARNTAISATALDALTTGDDNVALGYNAGTAITSGRSNTAIGTGAGDSITSGEFNTVIGILAGQSIGSADHNTFIGSNAGAATQSGSANSNVAVGSGALGNNVSGGNNVMIGRDTAANGTNSATLSNNTVIGHNAGYNLGNNGGDNAENNVLLGYQAGDVTFEGDNNIIIGYDVDPSSASASHELNIGSVIFGNIDDSATGSVDETQFGVGVTNASTIDASALVEFASTTRGVLFPRMTTTERNAINSGTFATGLTVYNTTTNTLQFYDGTAWQSAGGTGGNIDGLTDAFHDTTTDFDGDTNDNDDNLALGHEFPGLDGTNPGARNTAIGATALDAVTTGDDNVALGYNALSSITTGVEVVAVGSGALENYIGTSFSPTAIGHEALDDLTTGARNTAIGFKAGRTLTTSGSNTYIGYLAGGTHGRSNTAIGTNAMTSSFGDAEQNVAIGDGALENHGGADRTVAVGFLAARFGGDGDNVVIGNNAASLGNNFDDNVVIGMNAGLNIDNADNNILLGFQAGDVITTGDNNIIIGYDVDTSSASASNELNIGNTVFGDLSTDRVGIGVTSAATIDANAALEVTSTTRGFLPPRNADPASNITGTAGLIAYDSGDNELQYYNGTAWVAVATSGGSSAIDDLSDAYHDTTTDFDGDTTDNDDNLALGHEFTTLDGTNPGARNTAIGATALDAITTGDANTATGYQALSNVTTGSTNAAFGENAGLGVTTGSENTFVGQSAFHFAPNGSENVAIGHAAMAAAAGNRNTAVGRSALNGNFTTTITNNTALGYNAGLAIDGGNNNLFLGYQAGDLTTTGTDNIIIGYDIDASSATASNELNIGGTIFADLTNGYVGIGVTDATIPDVELDVAGDIEYTGTITDVSDRRLKDNIMPLKTQDILARLTKIDTYSFTMKDDEKGLTEFGVMAQELETLFPELVHTAKDEMGTKSVNYVGLIAPMIEATKELKSENDALKAQLAEMQSGQKEIMASLKTMQKDMASLKVHTGYGFEKANMKMILMMLMAMIFGGSGVVMISRLNRKA